MVAECVVLFRIQGFQQGGCRIAPKIAGHLIHFIQQKQGVQTAHFLHAVDQPARHRANIRAAMSADLRFIPHPAQRNTGKFSIHRFRNGFRQRSFTYAGRPYQT